MRAKPSHPGVPIEGILSGAHAIGGVATSIAENARMPQSIAPEEAAERRKLFQSYLTLSPATAGEIIVRGIEHRKPRVLVGSDAKRIALIERLIPVSYWSLLGAALKK